MIGSKLEDNAEGSGVTSKLAFIVAVIWTAYTLLYLCRAFGYLNIVIYPVMHRSVSTGLICILVFLTRGLRKNEARRYLKWYDILSIAFIVGGCGYIAIIANHVVASGRMTPHWFEMFLAVTTTILIMEATRRTIGWIIVSLISAFFFYAIYSNYFPGFLHSSGFPYSLMFGWIYLGEDGIWGMVIGIVTEIVAGFIIFGSFLRALGASQFFLDLALSTTGFMRGGPAKAAIIASTCFGTISGSTTANVATTGQITIPLMKETGYGPNYAGAVEAAASTGGMFMPPVMGATAFLIADFLGIAYWDVCIAAFLPAMTYYITLFAQVDLEAAKKGLKGLPRESLPSMKTTLTEGWQYLVPFIFLILFLGVLRYSPQTSIMYTLGVLIVVCCFNKKSRPSPKKLLIAFEDSAKGMMPIIPLCSVVGILIGAISMTGAATNLTSEIVSVSGGSLLIVLILTAAAAYVLGMGMTAVSVYILTVILLAPALIRAGVEPIASHMFLFYFGVLSFITPPVAIDAYIAAGISGGSL